jgi:hypothetical protein
MNTMRQKIYFLGIVCTLQFVGCLGQSRSSSYPFISGDTFRAIADHIVDETHQPFFPEKVKPGDIIFLKTDMDYPPHFFKTLHPQIKSPYILLTHNGDASPIFLTAIDHPPQGYNFGDYLNDPRIIVWFAQNIDIEHPKLRPLPLGIANTYWEHGNVKAFNKAASSLKPLEKRLPRIYVNFSVTTNKSERKHALDCCTKRSYCDIKKRTKHSSYLEEIKKYRYVLSPPGNGVDCHRSWEALLMGCIPIMKHSLLDSLFDDLPVIFVNNWSEITEAFLEQKYQEIKSSSYNYEKMYADYWIKEIKNYQQAFSRS